LCLRVLAFAVSCAVEAINGRMQYSLFWVDILHRENREKLAINFVGGGIEVPLGFQNLPAENLTQFLVKKVVD
jgi:hypothetical protein